MRSMEPTDIPPSASRMFTVRIWTERVDGGTEHRGHVRDVASGAYCTFLTWSDLTEFLADQLEGATTMKGGPS